MALRDTFKDELAELAEASRYIADKGFVTSQGGNLSWRLSEELIIITPTQVAKRKLTPDDIVFIDMRGKVVDAGNDRRPTGEVPMHIKLYQLRPDIKSLVHAHPPIITGFSMVDCDYLSWPLLPEPVLEVGPVLSIPYAEPVSDSLASEFEKVADFGNAWLMKNHGILVAGQGNVERTADFLEMIEAMAQSVQVALSMGTINRIPDHELENLNKTLTARELPLPGAEGVFNNLKSLFERT